MKIETAAAGLDTKFWKYSPFGRVTPKMYSPASVFTRQKLYAHSPPPQFPVLAVFNFYYEIDSVLKLLQPSMNLLELRTFCAIKVCLSSTRHSQTIPFSSSYFSHVRGPCLLVLPRITGSFRGFFVLFSSTTLETDRKYISTSWLR